MLAIYRRELKSYFTSVIACLFIAVTTLIAGIFFVYYNLSYGVSEMYSVYQCLLILVFTVPILTMKVIADERRQRTDQLILTAPVSVGKIVVGKFFALETIYAVPVFVMCLYPLILSSFGRRRPQGQGRDDPLGRQQNCRRRRGPALRQPFLRRPARRPGQELPRLPEPRFPAGFDRMQGRSGARRRSEEV